MRILGLVGGPQPRSLASYVGVLRAYWVLALLAFAATLVGAIAFLEVRSEKYEATAEVLVTPLSADSQSLLALPLITEAPDATRVSQTAAALLRSATAADRVAPTLPGEWDRDRVLRSMSIEPRGESNVIALTATTDSPRVSAALANRYTRVALEVRDEALRREVPERIAQLRDAVRGNPVSAERAELSRRAAALRGIRRSGDPTLNLTESATAPDTSASPSPALVIAAAIAVGLALAFGVAVLASLADKRILDEDELRALSPLPILARIPDPGRPQGRAQGAEALRTLQAQFEAGDRTPQVVIFTSASSGDGKTSSALRFAHAERESGRRVAFLSFDLRKPFDGRSRGRRWRKHQGGALEDLRLEDTNTRLRWGGPLSEGLVHHANDHDLVFALPEAPTDSAGRGAFSRQLARFIEEARTLADTVVVDTSPLGEVADALPLLDHCDAVVVVARLGNTAPANFLRMLDLMERSGVTPFGLLLVGSSHEIPSPYYRDLAGIGPRPGP